MVHAVLDARAFGSEKVIVWRISWHFHFPSDQSCSPHGLLLGNRGNSPDTWADEIDEGGVLVGWMDDVSNLSIRCCGICTVEGNVCLYLSQCYPLQGRFNCNLMCEETHPLQYATQSGLMALFFMRCQSFRLGLAWKWTRSDSSTYSGDVQVSMTRSEFTSSGGPI